MSSKKVEALEKENESLRNELQYVTNYYPEFLNDYKAVMNVCNNEVELKGLEHKEYVELLQKAVVLKAGSAVQYLLQGRRDITNLVPYRHSKYNKSFYQPVFDCKDLLGMSSASVIKALLSDDRLDPNEQFKRPVDPRDDATLWLNISCSPLIRAVLDSDKEAVAVLAAHPRVDVNATFDGCIDYNMVGEELMVEGFTALHAVCMENYDTREPSQCNAYSKCIIGNLLARADIIVNANDRCLGRCTA